MTTEQEALRPLTRDDTEHGVEYVRLSDVRKLVAEREADRAAMREALDALRCVERDFEGCYADHELKPVRAAITDLRHRLEVTK